MSNRWMYIAAVMCGRYTAAKDFGALMKLVGVILRVPFFAPRYNIAPTQMAPVIFMEAKRPEMNQCAGRKPAHPDGISTGVPAASLSGSR